MHKAIESGRRCPVKLGLLFLANVNGLQYAQRAYAMGVRRVPEAFKAHGRMAHGVYVVNLGGPQLLDEANQVAAVNHVVVAQDEVVFRHVRVPGTVDQYGRC